MRTQHILTEGELKDLQLCLAGAVREVLTLQQMLLDSASIPLERKAEMVRLSQSAEQQLRSAQIGTGGPVKI